jgi:hypothetical protein
VLLKLSCSVTDGKKRLPMSESKDEKSNRLPSFAGELGEREGRPSRAGTAARIR